MACMQLPAPMFNDLCRMLLDRTQSVRATAEWLAGQTEDAPARSSVERFSEVLMEEYRLVEYSLARQKSARYVAEAAADDPDAKQVAVNLLLTERITDELLSRGTSDELDTDRLEVLIKGVRAVSQTVFDKQKMDSRLRESEAKLRKAQADLEAKEMKLQAERDARQRAIDAATKAAEAGGGGAAVVAAIKQAMGITGEAA
ncbi:MAG TPA: phage protein Gp27 family protein [Phycisphaerae bacterium]|nr:phage protein Gp27 family protein [Phycisphaerae bacterium]